MKVWTSLIQICTSNDHLYRVTYTRCRIYTINSPDDGAHGYPKHVENRNKHTWKRIVCQVGYLQRLYILLVVVLYRSVCSKIPETCTWQYMRVYSLWSCSGSLYILKNFQVYIYIVDLHVCSFRWVTNGSVERKERRFERSRNLRNFNPLKTKRRLLYLKMKFVPRSKHFSSRL